MEVGVDLAMDLAGSDADTSLAPELPKLAATRDRSSGGHSELDTMLAGALLKLMRRPPRAVKSPDIGRYLRQKVGEGVGRG